MKKLIVLLLVFMCAFSLTACNYTLSESTKAVKTTQKFIEDQKTVNDSYIQKFLKAEKLKDIKEEPNDKYLLKPKTDFYNGTMDMSCITKITFSSAAPLEYDESWFANVAETADIVGYRIGTEVYIVGERIQLNPSSRRMFCAKNRDYDLWISLREIEGLEFLDASTAEDMSYMFCGN